MINLLIFFLTDFQNKLINLLQFVIIHQTAFFNALFSQLKILNTFQWLLLAQTNSKKIIDIIKILNLKLSLLSHPFIHNQHLLKLFQSQLITSLFIIYLTSHSNHLINMSTHIYSTFFLSIPINSIPTISHHLSIITSPEVSLTQ